MTIDEQLTQFLEEWNNASPTVNVHTSGSTGTPKVMSVEKSRMIESAKATCGFLRLKRGDTALLCMPLQYIAGKMMVVRSIVAGLRLVTVEPGGHPLRNLSEHIDFAAMVPLQVYNSLSSPAERMALSSIRNTLIGGGAINPLTETKLQQMSGQLWSTYGMTETLSHIALRAINGSLRSTAYTPFDGVRVSLSKDHTLVIDAPKISPKTLITNDIAEIGTDGTFTIIGRRDNIICSGGVKIQIEEVESLLAVHLSPSFAITQVPDEKFGQAVVLLVKTGANDSSTIKEAINDLPKFWKPKHIYTVDDIPMTKTGKKARADIRGIALKKYQLTS